MITIKCQNLDNNQIIEKSGENCYDILNSFDSTNYIIIEVIFDDWMKMKLPAKKYTIKQLFR